MNHQGIKQVLDSNVGLPLKEYLIEKLKELESIREVKILDTPTHQTIELKAQKKAYDKLKDILQELITIEEMDVSKQENNPYGIL
jgi:phage terminase large subunit